jgi:hypothetical protein
MAKNTYQTYTEQTPISVYRSDFMRRGAMCTALAGRHPGLSTIATEAKTVVAEIDTRREVLQELEDAQLLANAIEDAERLDVVEAYTELRRTMFAKNYEVAKLLPDAPSALGRLGVDNFIKRAEAAVANLEALPENDAIRVAFLANLKKELADLKNADQAEDQARADLKTGRMVLTLYKSELAQAREVQLGTILTVLKDREKVALFTVPWRKWSRAAEEAEADEGGTP